MTTKWTDPIDFLHNLKYEDLSPETIHAAKRCIVDTASCAAGGRLAPVAQSIIDFANIAFATGPSQPCKVIFDPKSMPISLSGAVLANATLIDNFDSHDLDGEVRGHVGTNVVPTALALAQTDPTMDGKEFLTLVVVGYEIANRVGVSQHATVPDYHSSGSWGGVGTAAMVARTKKFDRAITREALGIAEYNGPRSQIMRCIRNPAMVKDGSGWGAFVGVSAAQMAMSNFTGAPAVTVESEQVQQHWADLGKVWKVERQHFKLYAICYWAHAAMASYLDLAKKHDIKVDKIKEIKVYTFHNATIIDPRTPRHTEDAQYSLPYPLACVVVRGRCGVDEVLFDLKDAAILAMAQKVK